MILGATSLLAAIVAVYYARRGARSSQKSVRIAERSLETSQSQLRLAFEQDTRRPILEVTEIYLLHASQIDLVAKAASERRTYLTARNRYEQDKGDLPPTNEQGHQSPWPDRVLVVKISNKGKATALSVYGHLAVDGEYMWPLEFPDLPAEIDLRHESGFFWINFQTSETSRLLPEPTNQKLTFRVALRTTKRVRRLTRSVVTTNVKYAFTSQQGDSVEGEWPLEIQPLEFHQKKWNRSLEPDIW